MVRERDRLARLTGAAPLAAFLVLLALLVAYEAWLGRGGEHGFWHERNDYPSLALGHGINLDFWREHLPAPRRVGYYQTTHPGIPFQVASGLLYQVAHAPGATARDRALASMVDPGRFWSADRVATAALFLGTLCVAFALTRREFGLLALAVPLAALAYAPAWTYELEFLGNESFSLPLLLALWLALRRALVPGLPAPAFAAAGAIAGLCYLNKLNYLSWTAAAAMASLYFVARAGASVRRRLVALGAFAGALVASVWGVGAAVLGSDGFAAMRRTHREVYQATGHYGTGDPGVVKLSLAWKNLLEFLGQDVLFSLWFAGAVAFVAVVALRRRVAAAEASDPRRDEALTLFCALAAALAFLAAMKHYQPHYLVTAVLPLGFAPLSAGARLGARGRALVVAATAVVALKAGAAELGRVQASRAAARAQERETSLVRALPVGPGHLRIWTYRALAPEYLAQFVAENSAYPELAPLHYRRSFPQDWAVFKDVPRQVPWEYVVFTKDVYPEWSSIPAEYRSLGEVVFQGEHLIVFRRTRA